MYLDNKNMRYPVLILLLSLPFMTFSQDKEAKSDFAKEFGMVWERAKTYTLEMAEAMPEEKYDYKPYETALTYGGHLIHIVENWYSLCGRFVKEEGWPLDDRLDASKLSKAEIIQHLKDVYAYADESFYGLSDKELAAIAPKFWSKDPTSKKIILMLMRDHMTHHRGMLVIYLRENGIKPAGYRGW